MKSLVFQLPDQSRGGWATLETQLGHALKSGLARHGIKVEFVSRIDDPKQHEFVAIIGVRNAGMIKACQSAGVPFLYFDKAYNRDKSFWKISYDAHQPTWWFRHITCPADRARQQAWKLAPWRTWKKTGHILICGSSNKYHKLYDLPFPTDYWVDVVSQLKTLTKRTILYRPKKSWHEATLIAGATFSKEALIADELLDAHAMITHGSNSCIEALLMGVPAIVLGNGVSEPISSNNLASIEEPFEAPEVHRQQVLNNLAYCQWTIPEIAGGAFWRTVSDCIQLRKTLHGSS